ncbi:hypothetical protein G6F22_020141 [Rhizopus arrhizus]|nr:hypothetical protein G6F22_020141 [Rhizopus arrhizus]
MQRLVAAGRTVLQHVPFVRARDELHAPVLDGCRLQGQPDAQFVVDEIGRPERLVLMPGRFRAMRAGLEQRMPSSADQGHNGADRAGWETWPAWTDRPG